MSRRVNGKGMIQTILARSSAIERRRETRVVTE